MDIYEHIAPGDVGLLEAAGVPENPATEDIYTPEEQAVIDGLRSKGYCLIIWTPEEMKRCGDGPRQLENALVAYAHYAFFDDENGKGEDDTAGEGDDN